MVIDCKKCGNDCCGKIKNLTPILLPFEEKEFKRFGRKIKTPYREVFILKKKKNGRCIFFDELNKNCSIYEKRPIECRIYPYCLHFEGYKMNVWLDERFCKHAKLGAKDKKKILHSLQKIKFPKNWIKADASKIIQKICNAV